MSFVIPPTVQPSLAVQATEARFPVNQIFCVGRNYADHALEMGHDPSREPPFFFLKPGFTLLDADAALATQAMMTYPEFSNDVHHEVELVVALSGGGHNLTLSQARAAIYGYGVGLDMTRRDLQAEAKKQSRPWDAGKVFINSSVCSAIRQWSTSSSLHAEGNIQLWKNDELVQSGNLNQMIWKIDEVIAKLSELFVLSPGDLIYTGTPAGVGPVASGDCLRGEVDGLPALQLTVA